MKQKKTNFPASDLFFSAATNIKGTCLLLRFLPLTSFRGLGFFSLSPGAETEKERESKWKWQRWNGSITKGVEG